jgi:hypothetical protein
MNMTTSQDGPPASTTQKNGAFQLNVIFHGLWGIETHKEGIRAITVDTMHHVTMAGNWKDPMPLKDGDHELIGVAGATPMTFEVRQNFVVKGASVTEDKAKRVKVTINLPYPRDIRSIRRIQTHCDTFFAGPDAPPTPREIAIVQVLIYEVQDPGAIRLTGLDWTPPTPNHAAAINLHIFAEPPSAEVAKKIVLRDLEHTGPPHFEVAFKLLAEAFGLDITAVRTGQSEPDDYGIRGLTPEDTIGLHERPSSPHSGMPAASPINCEMLIINNTKKATY